MISAGCPLSEGRATAATSAHAASGCALPADRAGLVSAVGEVLAVNLPVAGLAQGLTVRNVEAQGRDRGKGLDVVRVNPSLGSAGLAGVAVAGEHGNPPAAQLLTDAGTFPVGRRSSAPVRRLRADHRSGTARDRAEAAAVGVGLECRAATLALPVTGPNRPAGFRAPLGRGAVGMDGERLAADLADALDFGLATRHHNIRRGYVDKGFSIEPRYVDVAVNRWQDFTGQKATRERR